MSNRIALYGLIGLTIVGGVAVLAATNNSRHRNISPAPLAIDKNVSISPVPKPRPTSTISTDAVLSEWRKLAISTRYHLASQIYDALQSNEPALVGNFTVDDLEACIADAGQKPALSNQKIVLVAALCANQFRPVKEDMTLAGWRNFDPGQQEKMAMPLYALLETTFPELTKKFQLDDLVSCINSAAQAPQKINLSVPSVLIPCVAELTDQARLMAPPNLTTEEMATIILQGLKSWRPLGHDARLSIAAFEWNNIMDAGQRHHYTAGDLEACISLASQEEELSAQSIVMVSGICSSAFQPVSQTLMLEGWKTEGASERANLSGRIYRDLVEGAFPTLASKFTADDLDTCITNFADDPNQENTSVLVLLIPCTARLVH